MQSETNRVLDWLIDQSEFLGVTVENWMLATGGGLLLYVASLAFMRRRATRAP